MGKNEKKKTSDTPKVRKPRKARAVMRSRKDSPAGHFADRLAANQKQYGDICKATAKFPGVAEAKTTDDMISVLNRLADAGFKPERKRGGRTAVTFTAGQMVTLSQEARDLLRPQFGPDIDNVPCFIATSYTPTANMKQVPVRADVADLNGRWVGFVTKGWVNPA